MKNISLIAIIFLICSLIPAIPAFSTAEEPGSPRMVIPLESWDFGKVKEGRVKKHTFAIKNTGTAELTVQVLMSCGTCFSIKLSKEKIPPGKKAKLKIIFDSAGKNDTEYQGYAIISSNDPDRPVGRIVVRAVVVRKI